MAKFNWKVQSLKLSIKLEGRRIAAMSKHREKLGAGTHTGVVQVCEHVSLCYRH